MVVLWNLINPKGNEWNLLSPKNHEDHIASKGFTSMSHYNLVHKSIPMPQAAEGMTKIQRRVVQGGDEVSDQDETNKAVEGMREADLNK